MLEELRKKMADFKEQMVEEGTKILHEEVKKVFDKYPELESFKWQQYTCYFNDGENCYFSAHTDPYCIGINGLSEDEYEEQDDDEDEVDTELIRPIWRDAACEEISNILGSIDDILEDIYGDHTEVTIFRDGSVTQDDYTSHD